MRVSLHRSDIASQLKHLIRITNYVKHAFKRNTNIDIEETVNYMYFILCNGLFE